MNDEQRKWVDERIQDINDKVRDIREEIAKDRERRSMGEMDIFEWEDIKKVLLKKAGRVG